MKEQIRTFLDHETGAETIKWTSSSKGDQHLYFTSPSITDDERFLVIISERNGHPNLYGINRETKEVNKISNSEGLLKSYTYPSGKSKGFSKASPYLDAKNNKIFWIQDDEVWASKINDTPIPSKVADLPEGWITGYTHLSPDGKQFCIPCTDPRAFLPEDKTQHEQLKNVPLRLLKGGYKSKLISIDTDTGASKTIAEVPFWITHVQFSWNHEGEILCNSEGGYASKANRSYPYWGRIWLIDKEGNYSRLFEQKKGEYVNHENFLYGTDNIIYHGTKKMSKIKICEYYLYIALNKYLKLGISRAKIQSLFNHFIAVRDMDGKLLLLKEAEYPVSHAVAGNKDFHFFTDSRDGYIYGYFYRGDELVKTRICNHGSSMKIQDAHPHPRAGKNGRGLVFTSDKDGSCNVYEVKPSIFQ